MKLSILLFCLLTTTLSYGQKSAIKIAKLKYNGGGDWYANKTALPNLIDFCNKNLRMNLADEEEVVEVGSLEIFLYPYVYRAFQDFRRYKDEHEIWKVRPTGHTSNSDRCRPGFRFPCR